MLKRVNECVERGLNGTYVLFQISVKIIFLNFYSFDYRSFNNNNKWISIGIALLILTFVGERAIESPSSGGLAPVFADRLAVNCIVYFYLLGRVDAKNRSVKEGEREGHRERGGERVRERERNAATTIAFSGPPPPPPLYIHYVVLRVYPVLPGTLDSFPTRMFLAFGVACGVVGVVRIFS